MRTILAASIAATLLLASTASSTAQADDWSGGYIGMYIGQVADPDDDGDRILFDTNLDGNGGDTVNTSAGANAFSPGFCDGVAQDRTPGGGCADNSGGADWGFRGGYDWDADGFVYGAVIEYGFSDARDADGYQLGLGYERRFWDNLSVGIEYIVTSLDDDETRVRAQGPAPATNPFILVNAAGTDFSRSDDELDLDSLRLTASFRF